MFKTETARESNLGYSCNKKPPEKVTDVATATEEGRYSITKKENGELTNIFTQRITFSAIC